MSQLKIPFFTVFFIFASLFIYTKLFGPIPFFVNSVQTTKTDLFKVTGTGEASTAPNIAVIPFGITKTASTAKEAQQQANQIINAIVEDLKTLDVEEKDIKTINYSINPQYDPTSSLGGKQRIQNYSVVQEIEVRLKSIEKANQATDIAVSDGANIISGIRFILDDKTQKELQAKARKIAIEKAKEDADSLANAAGITLGKIVDIQEANQIYQLQPVALESKASGQNTELLPGQNNVSISVTISYELR